MYCTLPIKSLTWIEFCSEWLNITNHVRLMWVKQPRRRRTKKTNHHERLVVREQNKPFLASYFRPVACRHKLVPRTLYVGKFGNKMLILKPSELGERSLP